MRSEAATGGVAPVRSFKDLQLMPECEDLELQDRAQTTQSRVAVKTELKTHIVPAVLRF